MEDDYGGAEGDGAAVGARVEAKLVDGNDGLKAGIQVVHFPLGLLQTGNGRRIGGGWSFL